MTPAKDVLILQPTEPDVPIPVEKVEAYKGDASQTLITTIEKIDSQEHYLLKSHGETWAIAPSYFGMLFTVVLSAALINNFVFTKYLGLCVFFGTSKKRDTAIGMGVTFIIVALASGFLSWWINHIALKPLHLNFLQIITFIGIIACLVQASDTILKKIQPVLHRKFGIYLVLITTNCIILAVPLLNATADKGFAESMALSLGAGVGFALALFLMSAAREKVELAPVPAIFRGLPMSFVIAGLFALSFLGFSGLKL
jgi:electron transport complex protein RnfA